MKISFNRRYAKMEQKIIPNYQRTITSIFNPTVSTAHSIRFAPVALFTFFAFDIAILATIFQNRTSKIKVLNSQNLFDNFWPTKLPTYQTSDLMLFGKRYLKTGRLKRSQFSFLFLSSKNLKKILFFYLHFNWLFGSWNHQRILKK